MIIVRLSGGLGNQMFQYACGRAVSLQHKAQLRLDHSFVEDRSYKTDFTHRDYALDVFGIDKKITKTELNKLGLKMAYLSPLKAKLSIKRMIRRYTHYHEKGLNFKEEVFKLGPRLYLSGYFQSEKYFQSIASTIREDFSFPAVQSEKNRLLMEKIMAQENSVSIHIRRGDYLTIGSGTVHQTCSPDYYKDAISIIKSKVANPTFFVFAHDDLPWAMDNLKFNTQHEFIGDHNQGALSYEDMRLMSLCKHHIIANSSFSWWGAWLNPNPNKLVIAPKNWLVNTPADFDVIPDNWIVI